MAPSTSKEEDYAGWLQRELDKEEGPELSRWEQQGARQILGGQLGQLIPRRMTGMSRTQQDALSDAAGRMFNVWEPIGIYPGIINFPWGRQLRFRITGQRGWFGFTAANTRARQLFGL